MYLKEDNFFSIAENFDRKLFIKDYFSVIRENSPIDSFFKNEWYSFQISGLYNYLSESHSHKWCVIQFEDDEVLVSIKFVTNFQHVYIRLQHYPKSLNCNKENEKKVFEKLSKFEFVQLLWEDETRIDNYDFEWNKRTVDTNFYDVVSERWKSVNENNYLKRRKIRRFLTDTDFVLVKANTSDLDIVKNCYEEWSEFIIKNKGLHNKKLFNRIFKDWIFIVNHKDIEVLLFKYKDIVLGCAIYVRMGDSFQNITEFSRTNRSCKLVIEDARFKTFLQGSAQIMNYFHLGYFRDKTNIISYAGSTDKNSLYTHKVNNYSKKIEYYSTKIN